MARPAPKSQGPLRMALWLIYDLLWIGLGSLVFGIGALAAGSLLRLGYAHWGWPGVGFLALPGYVLFLLVVVLEMGLIRSLSPRVTPGIYEKFKPGPFFALVWLTGLNNLIFAMPFTRTVHFIALLRFLYYRGQGMQTYYENWISPDVTISDPSMLRLGHGVNIGGRAGLTGHLALPDRMIIAPIVIGDRVVVGADSKIGPGVELGNDCMIGAAAILSVNVKVGEGAYVEAASFVKANAVIPPYERWGGHPAVRIGKVRRRHGLEPVEATEPAATLS